MERKSYLTRKAFRIYLIASILTALSAMLGTTVDGIIVSRLISADGLSAINLSRPIVQIYYTIYLLLGSGTGMLVAFELGKGNKTKAEGYYTMVWLTLGILFGIVTLIGVFTPMTMVKMLCSKEAMQPLVDEYMRPYLIGALSFMLNYLMGAYCALSGNPRRVSIAAITNNVVNLCFDLIFILVFKMGLAGSAWATVLGNTVGAVIMGQYLFSKKASFHIAPASILTLKEQLVSMLGNMLKKGAPFALASVCLVFYMYASNTILIQNYGSMGIFVLSVVMNLLMLYNLFLTGSCTTLQSLGALQVGENDYPGLRISVKYAFRIMLILSAISSTILLIYPDLIAILFKCPAEYLEECNKAIRLNAISFILFCVDYLLLVNYQLINRSNLATFISITLSPSVIPFMFVFSHAAPHLIWWSNLLGYLLVFVIIVAWGEIIRSRNKNLDHIILIPENTEFPSYDMSLGYDKESVTESFHSLNQWLEKQDIPQNLRFRINVIAEELITNISKYNQKEKDAAFDVHVTLFKEYAMLYTHDDGEPFNPLENKDNGLGLQIINYLSEINYKYQYGQNMTTAKVKI